MAEARLIDTEIWIFPFEWFLEKNEATKKSLNADFVALLQLGQSGLKISRQVKLLGVLGQAYVKVARNGKRYIIFKGNAGARPNLAGTRYLAETRPSPASWSEQGTSSRMPRKPHASP